MLSSSASVVVPVRICEEDETDCYVVSLIFSGIAALVSLLASIVVLADFSEPGFVAVVCDRAVFEVNSTPPLPGGPTMAECEADGFQWVDHDAYRSVSHFEFLTSSFIIGSN